MPDNEDSIAVLRAYKGARSAYNRFVKEKIRRQEELENAEIRIKQSYDEVSRLWTLLQSTIARELGECNE